MRISWGRVYVAFATIVALVLVVGFVLRYLGLL